MIKLGVIGFSEGNGHPFSWSAIFNGYNKEEMATCGFPVIGDYLSKQNFPADFLTQIGKVTHVYAQDYVQALKVKHSSMVEHIVENPEDLIGKVDAILLARDDGENHVEMAKPFLEAGLPIFIDKPFALSLRDAEIMLRLQQYETQIFTCSSLRFANELKLSEEEKMIIGEVLWIEASVAKKWETYAVHVIEPIISQIKTRGHFKRVFTSIIDTVQLSVVSWENLLAYIKVVDHYNMPLTLTFYGKKGSITKNFNDTFSCFKTSLEMFVRQLLSKQQIISREETLEIIKIIEWGRS